MSDRDMTEFNQNLIDEFRANGGKVAGRFANAPLLLLTTAGAKSGQPRTTPLVYTREGDDFVIIASKGGAPTHPDWYHNLRAHPEAEVELPGERFKVQATFPQGEEHSRLYAQMGAQMPFFIEYQRNTKRAIPVVLLHRTS